MNISTLYVCLFDLLTDNDQGRALLGANINMSSSVAPTLTQANKKDLDKFTKYLSIKAVQLVVQSRLGEKSCAPSTPDVSAGTSWYNLAIKDIPEVTR